MLLSFKIVVGLFVVWHAMGVSIGSASANDTELYKLRLENVMLKVKIIHLEHVNLCANKEISHCRNDSRKKDKIIQEKDAIIEKKDTILQNHNSSIMYRETFTYYEDVFINSFPKDLLKVTKNLDEDFEKKHTLFRDYKRKVVKAILDDYGLVYDPKIRKVMRAKERASNRTRSTHGEPDRFEQWLWFLNTVKSIKSISHMGLRIWKDIVAKFEKYGVSIVTLAQRIRQVIHYYNTHQHRLLGVEIRQEISEKHYRIMKCIEGCVTILLQYSPIPFGVSSALPIHPNWEEINITTIFPNRTTFIDLRQIFMNFATPAGK